MQPEPEFLAERPDQALMRIDGDNHIEARYLLNDAVFVGNVMLRDPFTTPGSFCVLYASEDGNLRVVHTGERATDIRLDADNNMLLVWLPAEVAKLNRLRLALYTTDIVTAEQWIAHQNSLLKQFTNSGGVNGNVS